MLKFFEELKNNESKRNNFVFVIFFIICIFAVILSFKNSISNIKKPFVDKDSQTVANLYKMYEQMVREGKIQDTSLLPGYADNSDTTEDSAFIYSKDKDTDSDGISDWDEVNVYRSSPFLKSTAGDGISDFDKIQKGIDPNCNTLKQKCDVVSDVNSEMSYGYSNNTAVTNIDIKNQDIVTIRENLRKILPENLKSNLDSLTDQQVKDLAITVYQEANPASDVSVNTDTSYIIELKNKLPKFNAKQLSDLSKMSEAQIKQFLLDLNIADIMLLNKFKTGELKTLILE